MATEEVSRNKYIVGPVVRFDQKNDMFKRTRWDPSLKEMAKQLWESLPPGKEGFSRTDVALLNAAYFVERNFAHGLSIHNTGLYSWYTEPAARFQRIAEDATPVASDPVEMSRKVKKAACFLGADLVKIGRLDLRWIYSHSFHCLVSLLPLRSLCHLSGVYGSSGHICVPLSLTVYR